MTAGNAPGNSFCSTPRTQAKNIDRKSRFTQSGRIRVLNEPLGLRERGFLNLLLLFLLLAFNIQGRGSPIRFLRMDSFFLTQVLILHKAMDTYEIIPAFHWL